MNLYVINLITKVVKPEKKLKDLNLSSLNYVTNID